MDAETTDARPTRRRAQPPAAPAADSSTTAGGTPKSTRGSKRGAAKAKGKGTRKAGSKGTPRSSTKRPRAKRRQDGRRITPGWSVTGVRLDASMSAKLLDLARAAGARADDIVPGRNASMSGISLQAMRTYAKKYGVALPNPGPIVATRREDDDLAAVASRRLWIKYPDSWKPGLEKLFALRAAEIAPIVISAADVWRAAILDAANAEANGAGPKGGKAKAA